MRRVKKVRFLAQYNELWGRKVSVLRAQDGYEMRFSPESGVLLIKDAKEGGEEVCVHASRCDVYLEPDELPVVAAPAPPPPPPAKGAPQVK